MIALHQNFIQNYLNATQSEDVILTKQVVLSEIAGFIYEHPEKVQQFLLKYGISATQNRDQLADKLSYLLSRNPESSFKLTELLSGRGLQNVHFFSNGGAEAGKSIGKYIQDNPETVKAIGQGIGNLFGRKKRKKAKQNRDLQSAEQADRQQKDAANKIKAIMATKRKGLMPKAITWAAVSLLAIASAVFLAIQIRKN